MEKIIGPIINGVAPEVECLGCRENCCKSCFGSEGCNLFRELTPEELHSVVEDKREIVFRPGETIFKQNTGSSNIICIKSGIAKMYVEGAKNKNLILNIIKNNEIILSGGILSNSIRPYTVAAITHVECCFISSERIVQLLLTNSRFALSFLEHYHAQRNHMFNTLVNLTQKYMPGKVADTLLNLKNNVFGSNPFQVPFSRQELAEMSAMTKESFVRILTEFRSSGLVRISGKMMEIVDEKGLIELSRNG